MHIPEEDFKSYITIKLSLAPNSVRHDMSRLRLINQWFSNKELTKENIEKYFYERKQDGLVNNSLNTYHTVFRHIQGYCKDRGLQADFYEGFKSFKKTKPHIVIFTTEEIEKLLSIKLSYGHFRGKDVSFLDFRYNTLTRFLAETGCRFGEAATLKIKYLDLGSGKATFVDTKTNENRTAFITGPLIAGIKQITDGCDPDDYVFRNAVEKPMRPQEYIPDLKKRATAAGILNLKKVHPHNFRHTYATMLLEAGVQITEVSKLLGHKDIQTTYDTYMHLADRTLQRAAMRLPLIRGSVAPVETIKTIKETLENFHLESDQRFVYIISESDGEFKFSLRAK
ncbi:MAG: site-specific integrase [Patescibacteria group bacterium]